MGARHLSPCCEQIAAEQGWDEDTLLCLLGAFLEQHDKIAALEEFLAEAADEENA